jgi:alkylated DNA repair protein alkB family protein 1
MSSLMSPFTTGLRLLPSLLPPEVQVLLISSLLHRDLANPQHKNNIHHDYTIPYAPPISISSLQRGSFFTLPPHSKNQMLTPVNPLSNHKPLNMTQFLVKKFRWLTLGSQYDWTTRSYDKEKAMPFPADIARLVKGLFKSAFEPESGVVLIYGSKDYMPVHRDVSEECERGLASFSLGCDGLFILSREKDGGNGKGGVVEEKELDEDREMEMLVLRVRSGDCVWMGKRGGAGMRCRK